MPKIGIERRDANGQPLVPEEIGETEASQFLRNPRGKLIPLDAACAKSRVHPDEEVMVTVFLCGARKTGRLSNPERSRDGKIGRIRAYSPLLNLSDEFRYRCGELRFGFGHGASLE